MAKKKIVRGQFYVSWKGEDEARINCDRLNGIFEGYDISYDCFEGEYGDSGSLTCFEVDAVALTFKEAEEMYKLFKKSVHQLFKEKPHEIISMKLERVI